MGEPRPRAPECSTFLIEASIPDARDHSSALTPSVVRCARGSSVELELGLVDISAIVGETVGALSLQARHAGVELQTRLGTGPKLEGDALRLEQLIDNLLTNAVKFSGAGKRVIVTTEYADDEWTVSIADDGFGIAGDEIGDLLQPFARGAGARERRIAGSGLGLAIVDGIAALHHASFDLDSSSGHGTTATVRLPVRQPRDAPTSS